MPVSAIGGLLGGFDQGRQRNEERLRMQHRMALEKAAESRLRTAQEAELALKGLGLASDADPYSAQAVVNFNERFNPGGAADVTKMLYGTAQNGVGAATARPAAAPSVGAAPTPQGLGGLFQGPPAPPSEAYPEVQGPPPPDRDRMRLTSPAAASDSPAAAPRQAPGGYTGPPQGVVKKPGYGRLDKQFADEEKMLDHQIKSMVQQTALRAATAEFQGAPKISSYAMSELGKRFGNFEKALHAEPAEFHGEIQKIMSSLFDDGFTRDQMMDYGLKDIIDNYASVLEQRANQVEAGLKRDDKSRQWLTSLRQEQTAFKQHVAESLGLKFSIGPNMDVQLEAMEDGDPRLAAYNNIVNRYLPMVTVGESGILVGNRAVTEMQNQESGPAVDLSGRPLAPASINSSLDRGIPVSWVNGDTAVKDPSNGRIYVIKKDGTIIDMDATKGGEGMVPGMVQPDQTVGPDPRQPQLRTAAEWLNNGGK